MSSAETSKSIVPLDEVNKVIVEQLQQDGRTSYAAIGKVVGLSEAAVRARVQRLLDAGVLQIIGVTNPMELGFARQAMVGVKVTGPIPARSSGRGACRSTRRSGAIFASAVLG